MDDPQAAVAVAVETLARELGCAPEAIGVAEVRPITWPNAALGCPEPGRMYVQVLTPGYQIKLTHAGTEHNMHTDRGHHAVHCPGGGILPELGDLPVL